MAANVMPLSNKDSQPLKEEPLYHTASLQALIALITVIALIVLIKLNNFRPNLTQPNLT